MHKSIVVSLVIAIAVLAVQAIRQAEIQSGQQEIFFSAVGGKSCYASGYQHGNLKRAIIHQSLKDCLFYINSGNNAILINQTNSQ